jgi:hypothetical protein
MNPDSAIETTDFRTDFEAVKTAAFLYPTKIPPTGEPKAG